MTNNLYNLTPSNDAKKPRFMDRKAPQENWNRTIPSLQVSSAMYEAMQEMSMDVRYEYGGKIVPIIREALEEFIGKYGVETAPATSLFLQFKAFRDSWVDEIMAAELLAHVEVIEMAFDRWSRAGDVDKITELAEKLMASIRKVPDDWRRIVIDRVRESIMIKQAFDVAFEQTTGRDKRKLQVIHDVVYGD